MVMCPNCGELVMEGDPYCSHCGTAFRWIDDEDDDDNYLLQVEYGVRKRIEKLIDGGDFKAALETIADNPDLNLNEVHRTVRRHYVEEYKRDHDISIYDEYIEIIPDDIYFYSLVAVEERHHGDFALIDECNRRIDEIKRGVN